MKSIGKDYDALKKQYAILKGKGLLQRDIAKRIGVSEKTVSEWAKNLPISQYYKIRTLMKKRLTSMPIERQIKSINQT